MTIRSLLLTVLVIGIVFGYLFMEFALYLTEAPSYNRVRYNSETGFTKYYCHNGKLFAMDSKTVIDLHEQCDKPTTVI